MVDVAGRIRSDDPSRCGVLFERSLVLSLERGVAIVRVDVVPDAHELLIVVRAREEDDGHSDEI